MAVIEVAIDFAQQNLSHADLVGNLSKSFAAQQGDYVIINLSLNSSHSLLYADLLILTVAATLYLRERNIDVTIELAGSLNHDKARYASRINFFRLLKIEYQETFTRWANAGRFVEITPYDETNYKQINDNIAKVVIANAGVALEVQQMLDYCLSEIMDNVLNHSAYPAIYKGRGLCCAQLFAAKEEIRLMICDTGIGIHKALTASPDSKYKHATEEEALSLCIQNGVTNGEGLGFGLYATSEFIRHNNGEMIIYSGHHYCKIENGKETVLKGDFWQGTFVYMKINTKNPVDYKQIMPDGHSLPDDYQFLLEQRFGINDDLW